MMNDFDVGFCRIACASPKLTVADPQKNAERMLKILDQADKQGVRLVLFPELALSAYTCGDLFNSPEFVKSCLKQLGVMAQKTKDLDVCFIVGLPFYFQSRVYNVAAVVKGGDILGVIPKVVIPNYREFYEQRWFASGEGINVDINVLGQSDVPFTHQLLFSFADDRCIFGVEICEDLWVPNSPSQNLAMAGAHLILNLSASNEVIGKSDFRRQLVTHQSAKLLAAYVYASSGEGESTSDLFFSGHCLIAENGKLLADEDVWSRKHWEDGFVVSDIDFEIIQGLRQSDSSYKTLPNQVLRKIVIKTKRQSKPYVCNREVTRFPFVPERAGDRELRCEQVYRLQVHSLLSRWERIDTHSLVIGVSGGLDSTAALLVCVGASEIRKSRGSKNFNVIGVSMPADATSHRTRGNAAKLCAALGVEFKEVDIASAVQNHLMAIGHDSVTQDVTFENAQARERTQILMDLSNLRNGIVVGTSDLSEIALGWTTYSGDHMSMYNVNCSLPKTLLRAMVDWFSRREKSSKEIFEVLQDILATPVSPELSSTKISAQAEPSQLTENIVGPYELNDFFMYHFLRYGASPARIEFLALQAFDGKYDVSAIKKWLRQFYTRFFRNQFKRNCMPDGPKIGTVSLSPRGDWRMPAEASAQVWLDLV